MAKIVNKYPVGIQTFEKIRENGYLYIDKTQYIPGVHLHHGYHQVLATQHLQRTQQSR